ncbi:MAG TPA: TetR/AcrR family transcriptional regulator [Clostridium sp.]|uniref:TetR/AcrR family transcriptional regulator n=1 Tax=Clostridium sp. TaxID=1506 RepID=UPI002F93513F
MAEVKTRQRIIQGALPLFREKGFDAVTIQDICGAASINKHTFYYHFKSKDELLEDYYNFHNEISPEMLIRIMNAKNYVEQVWLMIQPLIEFFKSAGPQIFKQLYIKDINEKFGAFKLAKIKTLYSSILPLIQKGKDSGEFLTEIENELLFLMFMQSFQGNSNWSISDKEFDFEKMMRIVYESLFNVTTKLRISKNSEFEDTWSKIRESLIK